MARQRSKAQNVSGCGYRRTMIIDCDSCVMRDIACSDCVVTTLLSFPLIEQNLEDSTSDLGCAVVSDETIDAISLLASRGIVRPMRYKRAVQG